MACLGAESRDPLSAGTETKTIGRDLQMQVFNIRSSTPTRVSHIVIDRRSPLATPTGKVIPVGEFMTCPFFYRRRS